MKLLIQRVEEASVTVDQKIYSQISQGLLVLLGITHEDKSEDIDYLINKLVNLRLFNSEQKGFDLSVTEIKDPAILVVSQFTLYANCNKGRRPDFGESAASAKAEKLYQEFIEKLKKTGINIQTGVFGADMKVSLINDGPVTISLESPNQ